MPELKNTFTGGKMDKDTDERIVPSGVYKEALNIEVSTSEDSEVGAAQNILGNIKVTEAIAGPKKDYNNCVVDSNLNNRYYGTNKHITHTVDPQSDKLYRFINTEPTAERNHGVWMDRIVEYDTNSNVQDPWQTKEKAVMVDIYKVETSISHFEAPSEPTKYGCYEGSCVDVGPNGINAPNITPTFNDDPTCGGGCAQQSPYCTVPSLTIPNGGAEGYDTLPYGTGGSYSQYYDPADIINDSGLNVPGFENGAYAWSPVITISQNPSVHTVDLRTRSYPLYKPMIYCTQQNFQFTGSSCHSWIKEIRIALAVPNNGVMADGSPIPWVLPSWQSNVSGLLYSVGFNRDFAGWTTQMVHDSFGYDILDFACIQDMITWVNTIPDWNGDPLPFTFTNDYTTGYGEGNFYWGPLHRQVREILGVDISNGGGGYTMSNVAPTGNTLFTSHSHRTGAIYSSPNYKSCYE